MVKNPLGNARDVGCCLVWDPTCWGATKPVSLNSWARVVEPRRWNYWSRCAQSLGCKTTEATPVRSVHTASREWPPLARTRETTLKQWSQSTGNKYILKLIMWFLSLVLAMYLLTKSKIYYFIPLGKYWIKISKVGEFPHGPAVKIPHFLVGFRFDPYSSN